jgi:RNA polymerase sigma-70 factor, ECF subfamily
MLAVQDTDEELMTRVAQGERDCLTLLMRRHGTALLTFLQRMLGNRQTSEDTFQEVFLAIWLQSRRYDSSRPFRAWLFGIAVNKARESLRKLASFPLLPINLPAIVTDDSLSPPALADRKEKALLVARGITQLPEMQRAVAVLRIWNQLSYSEIADALQCDAGTARSHMFYALSALRKYLEPRMRGERGKE